MLKWKRDTIRTALAKLLRPAIAAGLALVAILIATFGAHALAAFGFALALWVIAASFTILLQRVRFWQAPFATSLHLARITPRSVYGLVLAHAGIGVAVAGITAMSAWKQEELRSLPVGGQLDVGGYHVALKAVTRANGPNYQAERAQFDISDDGRFVTTLFAERRFYSVRKSQTTEAGIYTNFISNVYLAIGEGNGTNEWTVRAYYHPLAPWIWFGPMIMAFGGFISLSGRRFRVGAPQPARRAPVLAPAE
jgi:cytochrome c-type biogenesis protein CcmF